MYTYQEFYATCLKTTNHFQSTTTINLTISSLSVALAARRLQQRALQQRALLLQQRALQHHSPSYSQFGLLHGAMARVSRLLQKFHLPIIPKEKCHRELPLILNQRPLDAQGKEIRTKVQVVNVFRLGLPQPGKVYRSVQEMVDAGVYFELVYKNDEVGGS